MTGDDAIRRFSQELHHLYAAAGSPPYRHLIDQAARQRPPVDLSDSSLSEWLTGKTVPSRQDTVRFLISFLAQEARRRGHTAVRPEPQWLILHREAKAAKRANRGGRPRRQSSPSAPVPPALPSQLGELLRLMHRYAEDLPDAQPGQFRQALSSVYVKQTVASPVGVRQQVWDPELDEPAMIEEDRRVTRLAQPFDEVFEQYDHLVVEGAAGLGKSTLGRFLVGAHTTRLAGGDGEFTADGLVPLMLPARILAAQTGRTWGEALQAAVADEYGFLGSGVVSAETFTSPVGGRRWLIVIDALDEIPDPGDRDRLLKFLYTRMAAPGPARYLVTSRPLAPGEIAQLQGPRVGFFELQPFDRAALERFAERRFDPRGTAAGSAEAAEFLTQVRRAGLEQVLTVPLLATVAAKVFASRRRDQPLPSSRYELYQEYMAEFANRSIPAAKAFAGIGDERLHTWLEENRPALLEHLAIRYTQSETPLAVVADGYLRERAPLPAMLPAGWQTAVGDWLARTGLLGRHGVRLRFLHQTFAEHLAANAWARDLPPVFVPSEPVWRDLISSFLFDDEPAELTLVHYLHLHPAGHGVLRYLQSRSQEDRVHAGRLIARGIPCTDDELASMLDMAEGQILTGSYVADLRNAAGLVRHATVRDRLWAWLRDSRTPLPAKAAVVDVLRDHDQRAGQEGAAELERLLDEPGRPDTVRIDLAEVLARLGGRHTVAAAEVLRSIAVDPDVQGYVRFLGAEALAAIGSEFRGEAATLLHGVAADATVPKDDRLSAAEALARLGPEQRAQAADVLHALAVDATADLGDRRAAAENLGTLGGDNRVRAITALRQLEALPPSDADEVPLALAAAALLEADGRDRAAQILLEAATNPWNSQWGRYRAAEELSKLGGHELDRAARILHNLVTSPVWTGIHRNYTAAETLADLPRCRDLAVQALTSLAEDLSVPASTRLRVATRLARLGAAGRVIAARVMGDMASDEHPWGACASAAQALAKLDDDNHHAMVALFRSTVNDPRVTPGRRTVAAAVLVMLQPTSGQVTGETLVRLAALSAAQPESLAVALEALSLLPADSRHLVRDLLRVVIDDPATTVRGRRDAARQLAEQGADCRREASTVFAEMLADAAWSPQEQAALLTNPDDLVEVDRASATGVLLAALDDPWSDDVYLRGLLIDLEAISSSAAHRWLRSAMPTRIDELPDLSSGFDEDDFGDLEQLSPGLAVRVHDLRQQNLDADPLQRCRVAAGLAAVNDEYRDHAVRVLGQTADDMPDGDPGRAVLSAFAETVRTSDRRVFVAALRSLIAGRATSTAVPPGLLLDAAQWLAAEGPEHHAAVLDAVRRAGADPRLVVGSRSSAARSIVELDPAAAAAIFHDVATDPVAMPDVRFEAVTRLISWGDGRGAALLTTFTAQSANPFARAWDRLRTVQLLRGRGHRDLGMLAESLTRMLTDSAVDEESRVQAGRDLADLGAEHAAEAAAAAAGLLNEPGASPSDQTTGAALLTWLRPETRPMARRVIAGLAGSVRSGERVFLARSLADLSDDRSAVARTWAAQAGDFSVADRDRVEAAQQWLSLGRAEFGAACVAIGELAADPALEPATRLDLIVLRGRADPAARSAAVGMLESIAMSPFTSGPDRITAINRLARADRSRRAGLAAMLRAIADDSAEPVWFRSAAASELYVFGESGTSDAAHALVGLAADHDRPVDERREAAVRLLGLGLGHRRKAAALLADMTKPTGSTDAVTVDCADHAEALAVLASADPAYHERAAAALRRAAADPCVHAHQRLRTAQLLAELGVAENDESADLLAALAADPALPGGSRVNAAAALFHRGPRHRDPAAALLADLAADHSLDVDDRVGAACRLGELSSSAERPRTLLMDLLAEPGAHPAAAFALARFGGVDRDAAVRAAGPLLARLGVAERLGAVTELSGFGPTARLLAGEHLTEIAAGDSPLHRAVAAATLVHLDGRHDGLAVRLLTEVAADGDHHSLEDRLRAVHELLLLGEPHRGAATARLQELIEIGGVRVWERRTAVGLLARLGPAYRAVAVGLLGELIVDASADPWEVVACAEMRAALDHDQVAAAGATLESVAEDLTCPGQAHHAATRLLAAGWSRRPAATSALLRVAEHTGTPSHVRADAAATLIGLGEQFAEAGIRVFDELTGGPDVSLLDRALVHATLAAVRVTEKPAAGEALRRVAKNREATVGDRRRAATALIGLSVAARRVGVEVIRELASTSDPTERSLALGSLARWDATVRPAAFSSLDDLAVDRLSPVELIRMAAVFAGAGPSCRRLATALRHLARNPGMSAHDRQDAVAALRWFGGPDALFEPIGALPR